MRWGRVPHWITLQSPSSSAHKWTTVVLFEYLALLSASLLAARKGFPVLMDGAGEALSLAHALRGSGGNGLSEPVGG